MLYDVSRPVRAGQPVWPGDPPFRMEWAARIEAGDPANVAELHLGPHVGTHADGGFHALDDGARIGEVPLERFLGPARLVDATEAATLDAAWAERVLEAGVPERLLVRTGAWRSESEFPREFAALDAEGARRLVEAGVRLFGTDAPSVDAFEAPGLPAHHALLGAGAGILENLLLDGVPEGEYELTALPLRLMEADASPVRAVLRPLRPA